MPEKKHSLFRIYGFAFAVTALLLIFVGFKEGLAAFVTVLILAALEVTFSFFTPL